MTDLSQQVIDLSNLRNGLDQLMLAIQPAGVDVAGLDNARKRFAEIAPMFAALADGPLGVSEEDGEPQISAENLRKLKRMGLSGRYVGIENASQLFEMQEAEAEEKKALEAVADAKSKGLAAARSRFGN